MQILRIPKSALVNKFSFQVAKQLFHQLFLKTHFPTKNSSIVLTYTETKYTIFAI